MKTCTHRFLLQTRRLQENTKSVEQFPSNSRLSRNKKGSNGKRNHDTVGSCSRKVQSSFREQRSRQAPQDLQVAPSIKHHTNNGIKRHKKHIKAYKSCIGLLCGNCAECRSDNIDTSGRVKTLSGWSGNEHNMNDMALMQRSSGQMRSVSQNSLHASKTALSGLRTVFDVAWRTL